MGKRQRRLILKNNQSPGDIVMLTAAVRDLHRSYPGQFVTDVRTRCSALWMENPHVERLEEGTRGVETIHCEYPLIERSNRAPKHFIFGFIECLNERLGLRIEPTEFRGDIHLHPEEQRWMPQVMELTGEDTPYWIIVAGGKNDFTIKWWDARRWQRVVDHFRGRIQFVQVGRTEDHHPRLEGVIDLRGKTDLRQLVRLVYHAQGVVCPVTSLMHLAAAVPVRTGRPKNRACVVVAGGREPAQWEAYPHHQYIHTNGQLFCCDQGGCWKTRTVALDDGDAKDAPSQLCVQPVELDEAATGEGKQYLPKCMDMITPEEVCHRIEGYFTGGAYRYLTEREWGAAVRISGNGTPPRTVVTSVPPGHHNGHSNGNRGESEANKGTATISPAAGTKPHRMIAVTIGVGEKWRFLARLAAEACAASTGLETFILGEKEMRRHGYRVPHHLKYKLFHEFPDADSILFFDADIIFLQPFEARLFAGRREFFCVRDRYDTEEVIREEARILRLRPELYFNSGFFIVQRAVHATFLEKAQWLTGRHSSRFKDQTFLNGARHMLFSPIVFLPSEYNFLGFDEPVATRPPARSPAQAELYEPGSNASLVHDPRNIVIGHFYLIDRRPMAELEAYHRHWRAVGQTCATPAQTSRLHSLLAQPSPAPAPPKPVPPTTEEELRQRALLEAEVAAVRRYPKQRYAERGIIICGGGAKYFPCAWVTIKLLRQHGCKLPIELWHSGPSEMTPAMRNLLVPLGVHAVDGQEVARRHPVPTLRGWELKAFSLVHCRFREVLLLDADNAPVRDPSFLFDEPEYVEKGAVFWPDFSNLAKELRIWSLMGIAYRDEPAFESGQILVNKEKCWKALRLAAHLNEHSAFYYRYIHGDKDTFHMAWARLGQPYAMPRKRLEALEATMCQHDLHGRRLFQHRNADKWRIDGSNRRIPGFRHEDLCRQFIRQLRKVWFPVTLGVRRWNAAEAAPALRPMARSLTLKPWHYQRVGYDCRAIRLRPDGLVGQGSAAQEVYWHLRVAPSGPVLEFFSASTRTCRMQQGEDGVWRGHWEICEKMPVELVPVPRSATTQDSAGGTSRRLSTRKIPESLEPRHRKKASAERCSRNAISKPRRPSTIAKLKPMNS